MLHNDRALATCIARDLADRLFQSATDDVLAQFLLAFKTQFIQHLETAQISHTTARHHSFLHRSTGGIQGILNTGFFLLHLHFSGSTNIDHCHTTNQFCQAFLQLFAVIIRGGVFDLGTDLLYPGSQLVFVTSTVNNGGVVLIHCNPLGRAKIVDGDVLKFDAKVFGDYLAAGKGSDILKHGLATIAKTGRLDCSNLQGATQLVDHQGGQGLAIHILGDNQKRLAHLGNRLEDGKQILHAGDLFLVDEDERVIHTHFHPLGIGDKVRGEVATVKLHTLNHIQGGFHGLGFFNRDHAFLADLVHGLGDNVADGLVVVGGNGANLGDFLLLLGGAGNFT